MHSFTDSFGHVWDLDNPTTYQQCHWFPKRYLEMDAKQLYREVRSEIAGSLFYMQCWCPADWWKENGQFDRVVNLGIELSNNFWDSNYEPKKEFLLKHLFRVLDEIENQC